jgi:hypothetical protein
MSSGASAGRTRRRAISRSWRRSRLRRTPVWPYRGTTTASRGCPTSLSRQEMSSLGVRRRRPVRVTAVNSDLRVKRQLRGRPSGVSSLRAWMAPWPRGACAPSCAGGSISPDPSGYASAPGIRAYSSAADSAAGRSVSCPQNPSLAGGKASRTRRLGSRLTFPHPSGTISCPVEPPTESPANRRWN